MPPHSQHEAAIPNPLLKPWSVLVGEWQTIGKHRLMPDTTLHGRASFAWLEGGAFLILRTETEEAGIPSGLGIFGSDDASETFFMLYFDERGVSRRYEATLRGNVLKYWRTAPRFSQRFTGTLSDDGDSMLGVAELSEDDVTWKKDLELTYTRVK
jgi:hypothetical protein